MIRKSVQPWWYHFLFYWVQLIQSVVGIFSLGFLYVNITLPYSKWYAQHHIKKLKGR